jgi:hypothetical protein
MRARFGRRWVEEFGPEPTAPWLELLGKYRAHHLRIAIDLLTAQRPMQMPTLPTFEVLLQRAAGKTPDLQDHVRSYWRAVILLYVSTNLRAARVISTDEELEQHLVAYKATLGVALRKLLDELCDLDARNDGHRTAGMYERVENGVRHALGAHRRELAA